MWQIEGNGTIHSKYEINRTFTCDDSEDTLFSDVWPKLKSLFSGVKWRSSMNSELLDCYKFEKREIYSRPFWSLQSLLISAFFVYSARTFVSNCSERHKIETISDVRETSRKKINGVLRLISFVSYPGICSHWPHFSSCTRMWKILPTFHDYYYYFCWNWKRVQKRVRQLDSKLKMVSSLFEWIDLEFWCGETIANVKSQIAYDIWYVFLAFKTELYHSICPISSFW